MSLEAIDPRMAAGLPAQLALRADLLADGAEPLGWKVGFNLPAVQKAFGIAEPISGFLTTATLIPAGAPHSLVGAGQPMAEPELAIHIGAELAPDCDRAAAEDGIAALGPGDRGGRRRTSLTDLEQIVATNVFHRAVLFGEPMAEVALAGVIARVTLNGEHFGEADPLGGHPRPG